MKNWSNMTDEEFISRNQDIINKSLVAAELARRLEKANKKMIDLKQQLYS